MPRRFFAVVAAGAWIAVALGQDADSRVPFISTPQDVVERMLVIAQTSPQDLVVDLGSGDGRIVITAAKQFGARGIGFDLDGRLIAESRERARAARVADRVRFVQGDLFEADLSRATVVVAYLLPELLWRLQPRFIAEMQPGARIVSHAFPMGGWRPDRVEEVRVTTPHPGQGESSTLYLWVVPANVRGTWRSADEQVRIAQNYQEIEVEGASSATIRGRDISWQLPEGARFQGRVEDGRIVGQREHGATSRTVTFVRQR